MPQPTDSEAAVADAALRRHAKKIALAIHDESRLRIGAVAPGLKTVENGFAPRAIALRRQFERRAAAVAASAGSTEIGGSEDVAMAVGDQRGERLLAVRGSRKL